MRGSESSLTHVRLSACLVAQWIVRSAPVGGGRQQLELAGPLLEPPKPLNASSSFLQRQERLEPLINSGSSDLEEITGPRVKSSCGFVSVL